MSNNNNNFPEKECEKDKNYRIPFRENIKVLITMLLVIVVIISFMIIAKMPEILDKLL